MKRSGFVAVVMVTLVLAALVTAAPAWAADAGTRDKELVVDVSKLTEAVEKATAPIYQRTQSTRLKEKFTAVNDILAQKDVDKQKLVGSLKELQQELDAFTKDWDEITAPLWQGQDTIAETADKVRNMMARGRGGKPSSELKPIMDNYERRLTSIAKAIQDEKDPERAARLRTAFQNVLSLQKLVSASATLNLTPASQAVYAQTVKALTGLEAQLTNAAFEVEKARVVLVSQSSFIREYVGVMEGLIAAEDLSKELARMRDAGKGIGALAYSVRDLTQETQKFAQMMDGFAGKLAANIETETAKMAADNAATLGEDVDVDAEIQKYAARAANK